MLSYVRVNLSGWTFFAESFAVETHEAKAGSWYHEHDLI